MENKLDWVTIVSAVCVAAYVALAIRYVALFEFSLQEIRDAALLVALGIATFVGIDFFSKKLGKAG